MTLAMSQISHIISKPEEGLLGGYQYHTLDLSAHPLKPPMQPIGDRIYTPPRQQGGETVSRRVVLVPVITNVSHFSIFSQFFQSFCFNEVDGCTGVDWLLRVPCYLLSL